MLLPLLRTHISFFRAAASFCCTRLPQGGRILTTDREYTFVSTFLLTPSRFLDSLYIFNTHFHTVCPFYYIIAQGTSNVKLFFGKSTHFRICACYKMKTGTVLHVLYIRHFETYCFVRICFVFLHLINENLLPSQHIFFKRYSTPKNIPQVHILCVTHSFYNCLR